MSVELKFTHGHRVGDTICFTIGINNDANVLEYAEQFEVSLTKNDKAIHFPSQQGSILVTILEDPDDGMNKICIMKSYIAECAIVSFTCHHYCIISTV